MDQRINQTGGEKPTLTNPPAPLRRNEKLFYALTLRLERRQQERRHAWLMQEDRATRKLTDRCLAIINAIFDLKLEVPR